MIFMEISFFRSVGQRFSKFRDHQRQEQAMKSFKADMLSSNEFIALIVLAAGIASMGLLRNNEPVVIGAMIITPLVKPFVGIPLAIITGHFDVLWKSIIRAIIGIGLFFGTSFGFGVWFLSVHTNQEVAIRTVQVGMAEIIIAACAGIVAALALAFERVHNRLSGAAIALSIAPPLAISAIDLSLGRTETFEKALQLFGLNVLSLMIASFVILILFGFRIHRKEEV